MVGYLQQLAALVPDFAIKTMLLAGVTGCSSFGAIAFKRYADNGQTLDIGMGLAAYLISNWLWLIILREDGLGYAAVVPPLLTIMILTLASTILFGESLGHPRIAGLVFAALAIVLFSIPQSETSS